MNQATLCVRGAGGRLADRNWALKTIAFAAVMAMTQPVAAFDGALAARCFTFEPQDIGIGAQTDIAVELDDTGTPTAINVLRYQPDTDAGRRLAAAAAKAVQDCGPYPDGTTGGVITMGPEVDYPKASIITMPDRADGLDDSLGNEIQQIIDGK